MVGKWSKSSLPFFTNCFNFSQSSSKSQDLPWEVDAATIYEPKYLTKGTYKYLESAFGYPLLWCLNKDEKSVSTSNFVQ